MVHHSFGDIVLLFSFLEESAVIDDAHLDELIDVFGWESFRREGFFVLIVPSSSLIRHIESGLFVLISGIDKGCLFLAFCKFTSSCLFFYETCRETVTVSHLNILWSGGPGSNRHTQGLKP